MLPIQDLNHGSKPTQTAFAANPTYTHPFLCMLYFYSSCFLCILVDFGD